MRTIKITVEIENNDEFNSSSMSQSTFNEDVEGIVLATSFVSNVIYDDITSCVVEEVTMES